MRVGASHIWQNIRKGNNIVETGIRWKLGNGKKISFWVDKWIREQSLKELSVKEFGTKDSRKSETIGKMEAGNGNS